MDPRPRRHSLGWIELVRADPDIRLADIGARLGVTTSAVSFWLAGDRRAPTALFDVIAEMVDEATARRVARAIGAGR